jgi:hypothetical protein
MTDSTIQTHYYQLTPSDLLNSRHFPMKELRNLCKRLGLPSSGSKPALISLLMVQRTPIVANDINPLIQPTLATSALYDLGPLIEGLGLGVLSCGEMAAALCQRVEKKELITLANRQKRIDSNRRREAVEEKRALYKSTEFKLAIALAREKTLIKERRSLEAEVDDLVTRADISRENLIEERRCLEAEQRSKLERVTSPSSPRNQCLTGPPTPHTMRFSREDSEKIEPDEQSDGWMTNALKSSEVSDDGMTNALTTPWRLKLYTKRLDKSSQNPRVVASHCLCDNC